MKSFRKIPAGSLVKSHWDNDTRNEGRERHNRNIHPFMSIDLDEGTALICEC
jgi:hypothetical protein